MHSLRISTIFKMFRNCRTVALICFAIYLIWATYPSKNNGGSFEFYDQSRLKNFEDCAIKLCSLASSVANLKQEQFAEDFNNNGDQNFRNLRHAICNKNKKQEILPFCPNPNPNLEGRVKISFKGPIVDTISNSTRYPLIKGGIFRPQSCTSRHGRVAIIVPYRDRETHLTALLNNLHPILQRQQLNYVIIVVEQVGNDTFNKALLMNIAYKESQQLVDPNDYETQFQCYIFHDVDLFTEDDRGIYACRDLPVHLSEYVDKMGYKPFPGRDILFGGVVTVPRRHFELVNGFSNIFFGWGGEDDEMRRRFLHLGIKVLVPTQNEHYRFRMFPHWRDHGNKKNENRFQLVETTAQRMAYDGLNSLRYRLVSRTDYPAYTHFLVQFNEQEVINAFLAESELMR